MYHPNRYEALYNDNDKTSDDEMNEPDGEIHELPRRRSEVASPKRPSTVINENPEHDKFQYKQPRVVPGNSTYASMLGKGRKILLLSDSILGRIQMHKLNIDIKEGHAFRKYFPGATPSEIDYYGKYTLEREKPDVVVIHTGTNSIFKESTSDAANKIFDIVNTCMNHGVNEIFISGITYRNQNMIKVRQLNNFLQSQQLIHDFKFIKNNNITADDVGKDKIH